MITKTMLDYIDPYKAHSMAKLIKTSRGYIVLEIDGKTINFEGEAFLPGHGSPD